MQHYELMFIADPSTEEEGLSELQQKIEGLITGREGSVVSYEKIGKKRLAYAIAKRQYGIYFLVNFKGNGKIVHALDYFLRFNPIVIRHIIIAFTEKQLALRERTAAILAEEAERMRFGGRPVVKDEEETEILIEEADITDLEETAGTFEEVEEFASTSQEPENTSAMHIENELPTTDSEEVIPELDTESESQPDTTGKSKDD